MVLGFQDCFGVVQGASHLAKQSPSQHAASEPAACWLDLLGFDWLQIDGSAWLA